MKRGKCEVTGIDLDFSCDDVLTTQRHRVKYAPSLDRKNPTKGYTKANTRVVVWMYNIMKNVFSDKDVLEFATYYVQFQQPTVGVIREK